MEDGDTPVGGPLSRMEGVPPSRERVSVERGPPEDPTLECTDGSEIFPELEDPMLERIGGSAMCISEMQVIL